ncbi:MAG: hypothetical protein ABSD88_07410 [Candidatus Korobacteraceae bacterium]
MWSHTGRDRDRRTLTILAEEKARAGVGAKGCLSKSHLPHAAMEYGCDPRQPVLRWGERKVMATQEDVVIEEARRLAGIA